MRILTLSLIVDLRETALGDPAALVVEALSAGHAGRCRAGGGWRPSCASSGWPVGWSSGVAEPAIGVVALPSVHGGYFNRMTSLQVKYSLAHGGAMLKSVGVRFIAANGMSHGLVPCKVTGGLDCRCGGDRTSTSGDALMRKPGTCR